MLFFVLNTFSVLDECKKVLKVSNITNIVQEHVKPRSPSYELKKTGVKLISDSEKSKSYDPASPAI